MMPGHGWMIEYKRHLPSTPRPYETGGRGTIQYQRLSITHLELRYTRVGEDRKLGQSRFFQNIIKRSGSQIIL
jgi:hypothetical protein